MRPHRWWPAAALGATTVLACADATIDLEGTCPPPEVWCCAGRREVARLSGALELGPTLTGQTATRALELRAGPGCTLDSVTVTPLGDADSPAGRFWADLRPAQPAEPERRWLEVGFQAGGDASAPARAALELAGVSRRSARSERFTMELPLRARSITGRLDCAPPALDFGEVPIGRRTTATVRCANSLPFRISVQLRQSLAGGRLPPERGNGSFSILDPLDGEGFLVGPGPERRSVEVGGELELHFEYSPADEAGDEARADLQFCASVLCRKDLLLIGRGRK